MNFEEEKEEKKIYLAPIRITSKDDESDLID
jgi:hypothetical protein